DTLAPILEAKDREDLLGWIRAKPFVKSWSDAILVHAGFSPAWPDPVKELHGLDPEVPDGNVAIATRVRWCDAHGATPQHGPDPPTQPGFKPWFEPFAGRFRETVVFGHWARLGLVKRSGFRGLDTGCVWGGSLTAWIAETDDLVSVRAKRQYS